MSSDMVIPDFSADRMHPLQGGAWEERKMKSLMDSNMAYCRRPLLLSKQDIMVTLTEVMPVERERQTDRCGVIFGVPFWMW